MHNMRGMSDETNQPQREPTLVVRDEATAGPLHETTLADVKQLGLTIHQE